MQMLTDHRSGQRQRSSPSSSPRARGQDVQRGVHVRVAFVSACRALEARLRFSVFTVSMPAGMARLRRVGGRNLGQLPRLVRQHSFQQSPARTQNRPVQSGLRLHVRSRLVRRSPRARRHRPDVEILDHDLAGGVGAHPADLVAPVPALPRDLSRRLRDQMPGLPFAVRSILSSRHHALVASLSCLVPRKICQRDDVSRAQRHLSGVPVHSQGESVLKRFLDVHLVRNRAVPPAARSRDSSLLRDAVRIRIAAMSAEHVPAETGNADSPPEDSDLVRDGHAVVAPTSLEPRPSSLSVEESPPRVRLVFESVAHRRVGKLPQPGSLVAKGLEPRPQTEKGGGGLLAALAPGDLKQSILLVQRRVPDEAARARESRQRMCLRLGARQQAVGDVSDLSIHALVMGPDPSISRVNDQIPLETGIEPSLTLKQSVSILNSKCLIL